MKVVIHTEAGIRCLFGIEADSPRNGASRWVKNLPITVTDCLGFLPALLPPES